MALSVFTPVALISVTHLERYDNLKEAELEDLETLPCQSWLMVLFQGDRSNQ
jgi:hypothetical protein